MFHKTLSNFYYGLFKDGVDPLTVYKAAYLQASKPIPYQEKSEAVRFCIWFDYNGLCAYCNRKVYVNYWLNADHITPRALQGSDNYENIVCSCRKCNQTKAAKTLLQALIDLWVDC